MKRYHRVSSRDNIWILGLPVGAPPQAMLSLLPKGSKITSIITPERKGMYEKGEMKCRQTKVLPNELGLAVLHRSRLRKMKAKALLLRNKDD